MEPAELPPPEAPAPAASPRVLLGELLVHALGLAAAEQPPTLQRAHGCLQCAGIGYQGRVALDEVMPIEGRVRSLIRRAHRGDDGRSTCSTGTTRAASA